MATNNIRWIVGTLAVILLVASYIFQGYQWVSMFFQIEDATKRFILHRLARFVVNDALAIALIFALFGERKYVIFSFWVQAAGFLFLLLPYLILKTYWPAYNGPLLSFLHRIIVNPTLILLLIPAFYYQKKTTKSPP